MRRFAIVFTVAWTALCTRGVAQEPKPPPSKEKETPVTERVPGALRHSPGRTWDRITGRVEVVNARTLRFANGKTFELNVEAPELDQLARRGDKFYPAGRDAAAFLANLIGDRAVQFYLMNESTGVAFVGECNVIHELIQNGWAFAGHSSQHAAEIIARENKRGFWQGEFLPPDEWRNGKRLPGEDEARQKLNAERTADSSRLVGIWKSIDRHVAIGSLFQPVHGVRKREALVFFEKDGDRLKGHCIMADHAAISYQERWKEGRTDFRRVHFANDRLVFEFDIAEWRKSAGPLAVEGGRLENKGWIRVDAVLKGERLSGKWSMFTADGSEVFRGEWEADRGKPGEGK